MQEITKSEKETISLGKKFARTLKGGEVVLLIGDLGAGKTTFVKGVAEGLGIKKVITSPTFVLMKAYQGKRSKGKGKRLIHIDTYRGLSVADLENIGALEYFGQKDAVCFVEWGAGLEKYLKKKKVGYKKILIENVSETERKFEFR